MEKEEEEVMSNNVKEMKDEKIEEEEETQWIQVENGWKERGSGRIFTICDIRCLNCRHYRNTEGCTKCKNNRCPRCKDLNLSGKCSECYKLFLIKCMEKQKKTVEN